MYHHIYIGGKPHRTNGAHSRKLELATIFPRASESLQLYKGLIFYDVPVLWAQIAQHAGVCVEN